MVAKNTEACAVSLGWFTKSRLRIQFATILRGTCLILIPVLASARAARIRARVFIRIAPGLRLRFALGAPHAPRNLLDASLIPLANAEACAAVFFELPEIIMSPVSPEDYRGNVNYSRHKETDSGNRIN